MKLTVLDTETTGLDQTKGHRIIEIALISYDLETRKKTDTWIRRINPQRAIDADAQRVHGISFAELADEPIWEDFAEEISTRLSEVDLLIAHNMGFDGPFIALELKRVGILLPRTPSFCTMENARWATADGKAPKLKELCFALGVEYDEEKAHAAEYDVCVTAECFFRGLERGFYQIPKEAKPAGDFVNCYEDKEKA